MKTRAAIAFAPNEPLVIEEIELDPPGPGQILIRYGAAGLCHSDLHVLDGKRAGRFPLILGHEAAGTVEQCGEGVTRFRPGDTVLPFSVPHCGECDYCRSGMTNLCKYFFAPPIGARIRARGMEVSAFCNIGAFAEYAVVPEMYLAPLRREASMRSVCCIGCAVATGVGAVMFSAKVRPGSTVVVIGLGGIGLSAIQGARLAGAARIVGVDANPVKEAPGRAWGMTDFVLVGSVKKDLAAHLIDLTGGGADFAFECVGSPDLMTTALECTRPGVGLATIVGLPPDGSKMAFAPSNLTRGRRLIGSAMGGVRLDRELPELIDWYVEGKLKIDDMISHVLPLERINDGFELMRKGQVLRAVITFD